MVADYFDELMKMWEKNTDEHIEWQDKAKTLSILEHFSYIQRLVKQADNFDENTKHMTPENTRSETSILAAKFKNKHAIQRFLSSVLVEFSARILEELCETQKSKSKTQLSPEIKKAISQEVRKQLHSKTRSSEVDTKRKKKPL